MSFAATLEPKPAADVDDLAEVEAGDADVFTAACASAGVLSHYHYFPMLHFYGGSGRLRWEQHGDSILVYHISRRRPEARMNLFLAPVPFDAEALRHAVDRMRDFNGDRSGRITWIAQKDALAVAREGLAVSFKTEEYIFDRNAVIALEGPGFKSLRRELVLADKAGQLETRPYRAEDEPACRAMVDEWRARLTAAGIKVGGYNAALLCLRDAGRFSHPLLSGLVIEIDGVLRGFAFSGQVSDAMGCLFVGVTDLRYRGLPHLIRYRLMETFPGVPYFNDSTDAGRQGLRYIKQRFRPIEMHSLYGAQVR